MINPELWQPFEIVCDDAKYKHRNQIEVAMILDELIYEYMYIYRV